MARIHLYFQAKPYLLVLTIIVACIGSVQASDGQLEFLGDYIHVESTGGERCDGYNVMIWKYKGSLIGLLNHHRGLCGDPPMGVMEETVYSAETGSLSFKVKLSDGCSFKGDKCAPTKDRVEFKGTLKREMLEGVMTWFREGRPESAQRENVILTKDPSRSQSRKYETCADWMKYWEPILKVRGPQW